jgi:hypothetical protein
VVATSTSTTASRHTGIYAKHGTNDHLRAIQQLRACRPIPENQVRELCYKARELLIEEGNVVGVDAPVTVGTPCIRFMGTADRAVLLDMW